LTTDTFGKRLRLARLHKDMTQEELSRLAGCGRTYVNAMEKGIRTPRAEIAVRMADTLGVSLDWLLRDEPQPQREAEPVHV
jgi:transcriptional regulator with XRE-family HTH domain